MSKLLVVTAHPVTKDYSQSMTVRDAFVEAYKESHPEDEVTQINLYEIGVPPINSQTLDAWNQLKAGKDLSELSKEDQALVSKHDELLNQFMAHDRYVFVNPMYNLFVPAELKSYIDVLCVARKTFQYTAEGPVGLLEGKKALHIQAAGGAFHAAGMDGSYDIGNKYIVTMMNFIGVKDVQSLFIEGAAAFPEKVGEIVEAAKKQAVEIAKSF